MDSLQILHHGAINGVTGSCHELRLHPDFGVLIDCGLFQGAEISGKGAGAEHLAIDFPIAHIKALIVTHVHIDHVGRIPYLLAAGFKGPILCSQPSAHLLPLVLEDAVKIGFSRDPQLVRRFLSVLKKRIVALPYKHWFTLQDQPGSKLAVRLQRAGHILGSAYVECDVTIRGQGKSPVNTDTLHKRIVFSGDLGAPNTPLLPAPTSPYRCDTLVIESTYGDRLHPDRAKRKAGLKRVIERALRNSGVVLIPAFSIGRTQEILYELESIISRHSRCQSQTSVDSGPSGSARQRSASLDWRSLRVIVDSPLASRFTDSYRHLKPFWDNEAKAVLRTGRDPLDFDQLHTVGSHGEHMKLLSFLKRNQSPCIVIAASGMCAGGRIVNYLKALVTEPATDIVFIGYQAQGTPGREIQQYAGAGGYVVLDGERYDIRAGVHQLSGYSAHADQKDLVNFVKRMRHKPREIRLIHGDEGAKQKLAGLLRKVAPGAKVWIPGHKVSES